MSGHWINNTTMHFIICVRVAMLTLRLVYIHFPFDFVHPLVVAVYSHCVEYMNLWISFGVLFSFNLLSPRISDFWFTHTHTHVRILQFGTMLSNSLCTEIALFGDVCVWMHAHILPVEREIYLPQKWANIFPFEGILMEMVVRCALGI